MFKCQITGRCSRAGEKPTKVVAIAKSKEYKHEVFNEDTRTWEVEVIGVGWEIKKEISLSAQGLEIWENSDELQRGLLLRNLRA